MNSNKSSLNAILIQNHPTPRDVKANIQQIEKMLSQYTPEDEIDIILFPEMALTGYIFDNIEDVDPHAEEFDKGVTYEFCSSLAKIFNSYVFCGYPEKSLNKENNVYEYFNSCMIVDREGIALPSYRKHFLYEMDKKWCLEGAEFGSMQIQTRSGKNVTLGIGICMDINPYEFTAPWDKMEFSNFCVNKNVDVILFLTNWIDQEPNKNSNKEIEYQINYWAARLEPFFSKNLNSGKPVYFLAADRCGKERETNFIGCSCAIKIQNRLTSLLKCLSKSEEKAIMAKLEL
jgi:protein N-terminal amidase